VAYPNFLIKATRVMAPCTTHPYQSVMTIFMDMRIKGTYSSWSFRTPGLGRTSAQFCYTTPLFLKLHRPRYSAPLMICKCVIEGRTMHTQLPPAKQSENSQAYIYDMSSTLGFNISIIYKHILHTNIFNDPKIINKYIQKQK